MTEISVAKVHSTSVEYDINPPFVTTATSSMNYDNRPVQLDTIVVRTWAEGDDGEPYTTVDFSGYRLTKAGARKGGHGQFYFPAEDAQSLLDFFGIEVKV